MKLGTALDHLFPRGGMRYSIVGLVGPSP